MVTPNIDNLARHSLVFKNAYVQVSLINKHLSVNHFLHNRQARISEILAWDRNFNIIHVIHVILTWLTLPLASVAVCY